MKFAGKRPVVWEINAPANESLAFSWLGGRRLNVKESIFKRLKRRIHALRQMPGIWREEKLRRHLGKRVNAAICVSTPLKTYAQKTLALNDAIVLPNGGPIISEEEIIARQAKRISNQFTVFYSGSAVYPWQGLDYFSAAIELAKERAPDIRFVLAVNQYSDAIPNGTNVEVRQGLDREEILDAICASDVCVALHPEYFWSPYLFHGSPMKLFEYMACRTPVVTSNRGQMADIIHIEKCGLLCSDDPEDVLDKLLQIKSDPVKSAELASSGWSAIQHRMSWSHNVRKTLQVFDSVSGNNR
jgi:glycosyltransferase involved in cell wall biosynthesis